MPRSFRGYEVEQKIGSGGMSTLYSGIQKALNRRVAIKMLHPGLAEDDQFIARFEREAQAASAIGHRNIVSVFDFGSEDDVYYIVMELVQGMDMKEALSRTGRLPPEIVLAVLEEVSYGLEAAHDQGVIHRDIKPGNVMISSQGEVKIADFGLARQSSDIARISSLTLPGSVLGTPAYMSPEQAAGKEVDHRTDIYSLGVMAYELFTGTKPFAGSSYSEIRDQIINHEPEPVSHRAAVTPEIESLVARMLAKDPDRRFPSMRHVIRHLEDCMETLDPSGGLIKYRRKYLTKFAADPPGFCEELRRTSISSHLDRGYYFKKMGLAKIDDAVREFRYVLFLDPDNTKAQHAIVELEKEAEESGVRMPDGSVRTARTAADRAAEEEAFAASKAPPASDRDATPTGPPPGPRAPGPPSGETTRVLQGAAPADPTGATRILGPERSEARAAGAPAGGGRRLVLPIGIGVGVVAIVLILLRLFGGGGGGEKAAAAGSLALESEPAGAHILVRGPGETEYRDTGLVTAATLDDLAPGTWDVRLELAGHRPLTRRVPVGDTPTKLRLDLVPEAGEGRLAVTSEPAGASVRLRRPGEAEFRPLAGVTPLTTDPLEQGVWEIRVESAGVGAVTRTATVRADETVTFAVDLAASVARGRIAVATDPAGAAVRVRAEGSEEWTRLDGYTPVTSDPVPVGRWEVRLDKTGFEQWIRTIDVEKDETVQLEVAMTASASREPVLRDGFAKVVVVPFADVYLDGRIFEKQARATVVRVPAGREHVVELRHPTFGTKRFPLTVSAGDTTDLGRYDFKWGTVRVFCRPAVPADLFVDGEKVQRQTPFLDKIGSGSHRFAVVKPGFRVTGVVVTDENGGEQRLTPSGTPPEVEVRVPPEAEIRIQFVLEKE